MRHVLSLVSATVFFANLVALPTFGADDPPGKSLRELHVVGLYEGVEKTGNEIHGGRATVTVNRPGPQITLALTAYDSVSWEIKLGPGTKLERVILGGYHPQRVVGVAETVEVVNAFRTESTPKLGYCYKLDSANFRWIVMQLAELSDVPISSFHGAYAYRHEAPIVIDKVQDDPRLSSKYPQPTPLAELPDVGFRALHMVGGAPPFRQVSVSVGDFTLSGPKLDTLKALPRGVTSFAYDPTAKKHYGIAGHNVVEVDLATNTTTKMDLGFDVPRLSWPAAVTFDVKRGRLLLTAHRGMLYAYDVAASKWSVLSDEGRSFPAIAYLSKTDSLYALHSPHDENGSRPVLCQLNANGAIIKETQLGEPIVRGSISDRPGSSGLQLVPADDHLVIIAPAFSHSSEGTLIGASYMYLVEPKTGKVWLTWKGGEKDAATAK